MKIANIITSISIALILQGCAVYSQGFECSAPKGGKCRSISQINKMVDDGKVNLSDEIEEELPNKSPVKKVITDSSSKKVIEEPMVLLAITDKSLPNKTNYLNDFKKKASPHRTNEEILGIWFSPYEDNNGNFFEEGYVYIVITPSKWIKPGI